MSFFDVTRPLIAAVAAATADAGLLFISVAVAFVGCAVKTVPDEENGSHAPIVASAFAFADAAPTVRSHCEPAEKIPVSGGGLSSVVMPSTVTLQ